MLRPWVRSVARAILGRVRRGVTPGAASPARVQANRWLRTQGETVEGDVLSVGSGDDGDGQGGRYREYFPRCRSYLTSEVAAGHGCDMALDVRRMTGVADASLDCVFCSGVLEHVDDCLTAVRELHRILKPGGVLLLGLPFRQALHLEPHDYWRFTEHGIRHLLKELFRVVELVPIDESVARFPAAYWVRAVKR